MIKFKRLNSLKLLREKKLNKISKEIITLNNEIKKCNDLEIKLIKIKNSTDLNYDYSNSINIRIKYDFDRNILEQISICKNRLIFLNKELSASKSRLGKLIIQKSFIVEKIKLAKLDDIHKKEQKITKDIAPFYRKS